MHTICMGVIPKLVEGFFVNDDFTFMVILSDFFSERTW